MSIDLNTDKAGNAQTGLRNVEEVTPADASDAVGLQTHLHRSSRDNQLVPSLQGLLVLVGLK